MERIIQSQKIVDTRPKTRSLRSFPLCLEVCWGIMQSISSWYPFSCHPQLRLRKDLIVVAIKTFISQARVFNFVFHKPTVLISSPVVLVVKNLLASAGDVKRCSFNPWVGKTSWRKAWQPTPIFLPGESYGQRSPGGYSPWGRKESDTTEAT